MTERERLGWRGAVRACREERTLMIRRCGAEACENEERKFTTVTEFRPDGSLARQSHRNPDGSEWSSVYEYDDAGRLAAIRAEDGSPAPPLRTYRYDEAGRLREVRLRAEGGDEKVFETYDYDAAGHQTRSLHFASMGEKREVSVPVEGSSIYYSAPGATSVVTRYRGDERPVEMLFHDTAGRVVSRVEFRYDEDGHLVEERKHVAGEALPPEMFKEANEAQRTALRELFGGGESGLVTRHGYDAAGRRVETTFRLGPLASERASMEYNEYGDLVRQVTESVHSDYGIDDQGRLSDAPTRVAATRSEARFVYEYDALGNWTAKTTESRPAPDQEFTVCDIERRQLDYFE